MEFSEYRPILSSAMEAYTAFALNQKVPMAVLYPLLALGIPLVILAIRHL